LPKSPLRDKPALIRPATSKIISQPVLSSSNSQSRTGLQRLAMIKKNIYHQRPSSTLAGNSQNRRSLSIFKLTGNLPTSPKRLNSTKREIKEFDETYKSFFDKRKELIIA
jgi:hypothetical protein